MSNQTQIQIKREANSFKWVSACTSYFHKQIFLDALGKFSVVTGDYGVSKGIRNLPSKASSNIKCKIQIKVH